VKTFFRYTCRFVERTNGHVGLGAPDTEIGGRRAAAVGFAVLIAWVGAGPLAIT